MIFDGTPFSTDMDSIYEAKKLLNEKFGIGKFYADNTGYTHLFEKEDKKTMKIQIELEKTDTEGLWKAKGFNTLFFDEFGLKKVKIVDETPEWEPTIGDEVSFTLDGDIRKGIVLNVWRGIDNDGTVPFSRILVRLDWLSYEILTFENKEISPTGNNYREFAEKFLEWYEKEEEEEEE